MVHHVHVRVDVGVRDQRCQLYDGRTAREGRWKVHIESEAAILGVNGQLEGGAVGVDGMSGRVELRELLQLRGAQLGQLRVGQLWLGAAREHGWEGGWEADGEGETGR